MKKDFFQIKTILGNKQKLDGGAMFGNAPRELWKKWLPPDETNRIELACRCFLIEMGERKILLEAGVGAFFSPQLKSRFGIEESTHRLIESLAERGVEPEQITDVILSHLHFDHAGGLLSAFDDKNPSMPLKLIFNNARYFVGRSQWERALKPHFRDKASYIPELQMLLEKSGQLHLVEEVENKEGFSFHQLLPENFSFTFTHGHTPGLMHVFIINPVDKTSMVFASDLIPGRPWIHTPITMGYDRYPEKLIDEKSHFLAKYAAQNSIILLTHDPECSGVRVHLSPEGKWTVKEVLMEFV